MESRGGPCLQKNEVKDHKRDTERSNEKNLVPLFELIGKKPDEKAQPPDSLCNCIRHTCTEFSILLLEREKEMKNEKRA